MTVRVRFAPSPTGPLHIGGVRTALFNYLFARKNNGAFLLRIEDTDKNRFVPGAEEYIIESLKWCGIKIDEGQSVGGDFGPYKQSERKAIYKKYANKLIESGNAYYAFDTPEAIENLRKQAENDGQNFIYNFESRVNLNNSISLSSEEVNHKINSGEPYVIRFKTPQNQIVKMSDIIRGTVEVNTNTLDDKVLYKSDGLPTYHLANIVDDHLMGITHVIRGEEWLPSLPLHYMLYDALEWGNEKPIFAHLPLLLKPTGKGKLSKRDGEKMGFPVFPLEWHGQNGEVAKGYREDGYFADAFINMLALLGWNPGTEQEILSINDMIELFDIEKVQKGGARFDPDKAKWFNQKYLQSKPTADLLAPFQQILKSKSINTNNEKDAQIIELVKERASFIYELWDHAYFFYETPTEYDPKVVKKRWKNNVPDIIKQIGEKLSDEKIWEANHLKEIVSEIINANEAGFGAVMNALRLSIVGGGMGPDLFQIIEIIGQKESLERINNAIDTLTN
ncbi:MAG: glutamate--tRNA ligase [Salinivirgaceae bacterium]|nr:MAG: glutamate--tRNA ligase [Salinivirgaceae bacterium]